jgi:tetratricopeptide (TPR) repeat protein
MYNKNAIIKGIVGGVLALAFIGVLFTVFSRAYHGFTIASGVGQGQDEYNKAAELYKKKQFSEAAVLFSRLRLSQTANTQTIKDATNGEVFCYRELGHMAQSKNDPQTALRWYEKALQVNPNDAQAKAEYDAILRLLNSLNTQKALTSGQGQVVASQTPVGNPPRNPLQEPNFNRPTMPPLPGVPEVTTQDFARQNAMKAQAARDVLQKANAAWQQGNVQEALRLWNETSITAPGSPASLEAQQHLLEYNRQNPAFN